MNPEPFHLSGSPMTRFDFPHPRLLLISFLLFSFLFLSAPALAQGPQDPVRLLKTDPQGFSLRLDASSVHFQQDSRQGTACLRIRDADGQFTGPVKGLLAAAPPAARVIVHTRVLQTRPVPGAQPFCAQLDGDEATWPEQPRVVDLGFMRSQRIVRLELPLLQFDEERGAWQWITQMDVQVTFEGGRAGIFVPEPDSFERIFQSLLVNPIQARALRGQPQVTPPEVGVWTPPSPAWRVLVNQPGIYQLTYQDLRDAGLPVDTLDPHTLKLFNFGKEIAITVTGEADSRLDPGDVLYFYGQGVDTRYTDVNVYWLTYGHGNGLRMNTRLSSGTAPSAVAYPRTLHQETNRFYVSTLPMSEGHDHWYGPMITVSGQHATRHRDYRFTLEDLATEDGQAHVRWTVAGNVKATHHLRVYVNGQQVHDGHWQDRTLDEGDASFDSSYLQEGQNVVRLEFINDAPNQTIDQFYIDWVALTYPRRFRAQNNRLDFEKTEALPRTFQIDGFTTSSLEVFDITDPSRVLRIQGWQALNMGSEYRLQFTDPTTQSRHFWVQAQTHRLSPLAIQAKEPMARPLASGANRADYLIIYHPDFRNAIQPLVAHRTQQGYRVLAVSTQEIYDEFGYGMMSAEAIHDFLAYAYTTWQRPAPSMVVLVGDGTYDMRHYLATSGDTYLPPYLAMVDLSLGETAADNRFVTLTQGDILPDMHIGRLPANTPEEVTTMVNKIVIYENTSPGATWTQNILFVTDNLEGGGGNFYELSDAIADGYLDPPYNTVKLIPEDYQRIKLYLDLTCNSGESCRQSMANVLNNNGALFVSYIGHGTKTYWASERIWDINAVEQLHNGPKYPIMLPMTCNEGYFQEADRHAQSASEASVRLPGHGAVASWAPTGFGLSTGHDYLERGFFQGIFHQDIHEMGPATTHGKLYLAANAAPGKYDDLIDTFLLLGDPGLRLPIASSPPPLQKLYLPRISSPVP